jgi:hypothetical protein
MMTTAGLESPRPLQFRGSGGLAARRYTRSNPWMEVLISGECAPQGTGITAESSPALP